MSIIRAIDLGYGAVKYSTGTPSDPGRVVHRSFASVCVPSVGQANGVEQDKFSALAVMDIRTKDGVFMVGPQASELLSDTSGRSRVADYWDSAHYHALMLATLSYMGERRIDELVLGLPYSTYRQASKSALTTRYSGQVKITRADSAKDTVVDVGHVSVIPQPLGGYISADKAEALHEDRQHVLVIDPGYFTVDFVVFTPQHQLLQERSHALHGGMSKLYSLISRIVCREHGVNLFDLSTIETALRNRTSIKLNPDEIPLEPMMERVKAEVAVALREVFQTAQLERRDIGQILVLGGGAPLFAEVARTMTRLPVVVPNDPAFANLDGFQKFGESVAPAREVQAGRRAA